MVRHPPTHSFYLGGEGVLQKIHDNSHQEVLTNSNFKNSKLQTNKNQTNDIFFILSRISVKGCRETRGVHWRKFSLFWIWWGKFPTSIFPIFNSPLHFGESMLGSKNFFRTKKRAHSIRQAIGILEAFRRKYIRAIWLVFKRFQQTQFRSFSSNPRAQLEQTTYYFCCLHNGIQVCVNVIAQARSKINCFVQFELFDYLVQKK